MAVLPILRIQPGSPDGSPEILYTPAREVTDFSPALRCLAGDLLDTLRHHGAAGIAAPQAGIPFRLAVIDQEGREPLVLVNPRVTAEHGPVSEGFEACLSVPGIVCVVPRPPALVVDYQDLEGVGCRLEARGLFARVIAHELDHLDGIPGPKEPGASRGVGAPLEGILCTGRATRSMPAAEP